jgi:hypothetical protein
VHCRFQAATNLDAIEFRHHDIEQDEVRYPRFRDRKCLLAIRSLAQVVTLGCKPRRQDVAVGVVEMSPELFTGAGLTLTIMDCSAALSVRRYPSQFAFPGS